MSIQIRTLALFAIVALSGSGVLAQSTGVPSVRYRLQPGSVYEEGCYYLCECPISQSPLVGTFELEILPTGSPLDTYAFRDIDFFVPVRDLPIEGSGIYVRAGEYNQISLALQLDGAPAMDFSTFGPVPAGAEFPEIDVVVSVHGMMECYDYVLHIVAAKETTPYPWLTVAPFELEWSGVSGANAYDVVCGDLTTLRGTSGDFATSTDLCLADAVAQTVMSYDLTPPPGGAVWFLVRDHLGSYDSGSPSQPESRDAGIEAASPTCP